MSTPLKFLPNPTGQCPPDGYRYTFEQDGHRVEAITYGDWREKIVDHYKRNGYAMPENFMAIAEDQLCQILPPGFCVYIDGTRPTNFVNPRFGILDVIHGTSVLASWTMNGAEVVPTEEAERRADICSKCFLNIAVEGCGPCHALANVVAQANGARQTKADQFLRVCGVCKCSNKAQVWVPVEHLAKGTTPEMLEQFSPFCWKKAALEPLMLNP